MAEIKFTKLEQAYIDQCFNEWGFLDDSEVNLFQYVTKGVSKDFGYATWKADVQAKANKVKAAVKASLAKKGIIYLEEHRTEAEGGDLWAISQKYDHLFEEV